MLELTFWFSAVVLMHFAHSQPCSYFCDGYHLKILTPFQHFLSVLFTSSQLLLYPKSQYFSAYMHMHMKTQRGILNGMKTLSPSSLTWPPLFQGFPWHLSKINRKQLPSLASPCAALEFFMVIRREEVHFLVGSTLELSTTFQSKSVVI